MMIKTFVALTLLLLLHGCNLREEKNIEYLAYRSRFGSISSPSPEVKDSIQTINLCKVFDKSEWDSIAVIRPYLPEKYLRSFDFGTNSEIKDSMEYVIQAEWAQGLLFYEGNTITGYSVISSNVSFSKFDVLSPKAVPIITHSECEAILTKTVSSKGHASFFILPHAVIEAWKFQRIEYPRGSLDSLLSK